MTDNLKNEKIQALGQLIQKNLEVVQKALGIETACDEDKITEMELESEMVADKVVSVRNNSTTTKTTSGLLEQRHYLAIKSVELKATFTKSQVLFAESRAKFINRQQARSHQSQN